MPTKYPTRYVIANGIKTAYLDAGKDSPVLVALHGGGAGSSGAAGMSKLADRLQGEMRIVAPDGVGGFGWTDPNAPTPYGAQSRVDQVAGLLDTLALDKVHLIGNSQGAWVAARYAIQHPDRVKSMTLIASGTIGKAMGLEMPPTPGLAALFGFDGTREGMRKMLIALVDDPANVTDELIDARIASATRAGAAESVKRFAVGNKYLETDPIMSGNFDMRQSLPIVTKLIPTQFLWGEGDTMVMPSMGRQLEKLLPDVRFVFIPGAGHQAQTDKPDLIADLVRKQIALAG